MTGRLTRAALGRLEERLLDDLRALQEHTPADRLSVFDAVARRLGNEQDRRAWGDHRRDPVRDPVREILEALPEETFS